LKCQNQWLTTHSPSLPFGSLKWPSPNMIHTTLHLDETRGPSCSPCVEQFWCCIP
jgi:hypothetical protein